MVQHQDIYDTCRSQAEMVQESTFLMMRFTLLIFCLTIYCSPLLAGEPEDMVRISSGTFWMGSDTGNKMMPRGGRNNESPIHEVTVDGFWMDIYPVTNGRYAKFGKETGYVT